MKSNQRWFGWIAIGLGSLALLVALAGRGFGPLGAGGFASANMPQVYVQQGAQNGANAQPGVGPQGMEQQGGSAAQRPNGQQGRRHSGNEPQNAPGRPHDGAQGRSGRPGNRGGGQGGWFGLPFTLFGGVSRLGMLALVVVLGVWLLRGRGTAGASTSERAAPAQGPAQEPLSPTGESYTDEPSERD